MKLNVVLRSVRPFRKALMKQARNGRHSLKIVGQRGQYAVAVHIGNRLVICSQIFDMKTSAVRYCYKKTRRKPATRTYSHQFSTPTVRKAA